MGRGGVVNDGNNMITMLSQATNTFFLYNPRAYPPSRTSQAEVLKIIPQEPRLKSRWIHVLLEDIGPDLLIYVVVIRS